MEITMTGDEELVQRAREIALKLVYRGPNEHGYHVTRANDDHVIAIAAALIIAKAIRVHSW